jgi:hypothetical protein
MDSKHLFAFIKGSFSGPFPCGRSVQRALPAVPRRPGRPVKCGRSRSSRAPRNATGDPLPARSAHPQDPAPVRAQRPHATGPRVAGDISAHTQRPDVPTDPCAHRLRIHEFTRPPPAPPPDPHIHRCWRPDLTPPIPARLVAPALALSRSSPQPPREHRAPWTRQRPHGSPAAARLGCLRATPAPKVPSASGIPSEAGKSVHVIAAFPGFPVRRPFAIISLNPGWLIAAKRSRAIPGGRRSGRTFSVNHEN